MNAAPLITIPYPVRLKNDDFWLLNDHGTFAEYAKTELIEGEILCMNAQHSRHARIKSDMLVELALALRSQGTSLKAISEVSVALSADSVPEPDIVLTSYMGDGPVPLETLALVVEVSDTTLDFDLGRKLALYARAGVPEYWVVDVVGRTVYQHWSPAGEAYVERRTLDVGQSLLAATISGLAVETSALG